MNRGKDVHEITGRAGRIELDMKIYNLSQDICILIWGGSSHVGAVVTAVPGKEEPLLWAIDLPQHKDVIIARPVALKVCRVLKCKVTVVCGIHYDNITKTEIEEIKVLSEEMTGEAAEYLAGNQ